MLASQVRLTSGAARRAGESAMKKRALKSRQSAAGDRSAVVRTRGLLQAEQFLGKRALRVRSDDWDWWPRTIAADAGTCDGAHGVPFLE
jgi:hypothetical protein